MKLNKTNVGIAAVLSIVLFIAIYHAIDGASSVAPPLKTGLTLKNDFVISELAWHPGGEYLAVAGGLNRKVNVWNVQTGQLVKEYDGQGGVGGIAYSNNGRYLAVSRTFADRTQDKAIANIYETGGSATPVRNLVAPRGGDGSVVAVVNDGKNVVTTGGNHSGQGLVYELSTGKLVDTLATRSDEIDAIKSLAYCKQQGVVAIGRISGWLEIYATNTWELLRSIRAHSGGVTALTCSPDGKQIAYGGKFPAPIELIDLETYKSTRSYSTGHQGIWIRELHITPDGKAMITGGSEKLVEIRSIDDPEKVIWQKRFDHVAYPTLSIDGKYLAIGAGKEVFVFDVAGLSSITANSPRRAQ